jgi:diacylglycerol kinase (ATP)
MVKDIDKIENREFRKIGFVVNPKAGVRKRAYEEIKTLAQKIFNGRHQIEIHLTRGVGDATQIADHFVQNQFDVVAAVGGDGTANETAQSLMGKDTAFTVIPYGSGNGLARGLSISMNREKAMRAILTGKTRWIDAGEVYDGDTRKLFIGFAGTGYDAFVGKLFNEVQGRRGLLKYIYLSIAAYHRFTPTAMKIKINEKEIYARPFILAVANTNQYGNGAKIAPHAVPDDGYFEVCLLQDITMRKGLMHGWRLFSGSIDRLAEVTILRAKDLEIIPESTIHYHLDGEPQTTSNALRFNVLPKRIRLIVSD